MLKTCKRNILYYKFNFLKVNFQPICEEIRKPYDKCLSIGRFAVKIFAEVLNIVELSINLR